MLLLLPLEVDGMLGRGSCCDTGLMGGAWVDGTEVGVRTGGSVGMLDRAEDGGRVVLLGIAIRLVGCSSAGSSRLRFRWLTDGGISFPIRGREVVYDGELSFMGGIFQLDSGRNTSLPGGEGSLEAGDKDGNGGVGPELGEMRSEGVMGANCSPSSGTKDAVR